MQVTDRQRINVLINSGDNLDNITEVKTRTFMPRSTLRTFINTIKDNIEFAILLEVVMSTCSVYSSNISGNISC